MPIDRTWFNTLVDDDGSSTVGTVWNKAQINSQLVAIDAALALVEPVYGAFTPVDISGGLGNLGNGQSVKIGRLWAVFLSIAYPANSNGAQAAIGGLPFGQTNAVYGAIYQGFGGVPYRTYIAAGTNVITMLNATNGGALTNAQLSGSTFHLHGVCLAG